MTDSPPPAPDPLPNPTGIVGWYNLAAVALTLARTDAGRRRLFILAGLLGLAGLAGLVDGTWIALPDIAPIDPLKSGWDEALSRKVAPVIAAQMPKFAITDEDGNIVSGAGKSAELWRFAKIANRGNHIPTWRQQSGDCVSMGWSNAVAYRQAYQIAQEQRAETLRIPFPPYMYGISRVQIGKRQLGRTPGSVGAWAAQGSQAYGVYPTDQATADNYRYSRAIADQWGQTGPPKEAIDYAAKFRIRTVSQVRTWEDVRDALVHGYPVTVASNVGFDGGSRDEDGKRWLLPKNRWGHQMTFIGAEDRANRKRGACCLNSWGADAHPKPLNDEPPGSFWVDAMTVERMVQQGDSWAYSDFDGFKAELADWNAFKEDNIRSGNTANVIAAEAPEPVTVLEVRKMYATYVSLTLIGVALLCAVWAVAKRGQRQNE